MKKLRILYIEPFYGGSHRDFADGFIEHSTHEISLFTLPARYWKWRMRGAALYFSENISNPQDYDILFTSDMMSLSDLRMLWGKECPPAVVYFHENQLSYPLPEGEKMDYQFGFTDITTGLAADRLIFNSHFHLESFLKNMPGFIKKMPEYKPLWAVERIRRKSGVIYPGCRFHHNASPDTNTCRPGSAHIPLVIWNHRWEFDKCPEVFFSSLLKADRILKSRGFETPFSLALLGENFQSKPKSFIEAKKYYGGRILQYGYCENRDEYSEWLARGDIAVSTAIQENFGISVVEAVSAGCIPLLPDRLSYPELLPAEYHRNLLYSTTDELTDKLVELLVKLHSGQQIDLQPALSGHFARYSWDRMIGQYDGLFTETFDNYR